MYPPKFDYHRAQSVAEAIALLGQNQDAKLLAGGHSLLPVMKLRLAQPDALIDIGRLAGMKGIQREGDRIVIGALTTHAMVAAAEGLPTALTEAAGWIGDPQVRNRGTVGGNVAHADPASDLPTVFTALHARFHIAGPGGQRVVAADDFFLDLFATALAADEVLTAVIVRAEQPGTGSGYAKMFNPASRYAIVGAAAVVMVENGLCKAASVAVGGLTPRATRAAAVEAALTGQPLNADSIAAAAQAVQDDLNVDELLGDIHASAAYRYEMAPVFVKRALSKAAERAG